MKLLSKRLQSLAVTSLLLCLTVEMINSNIISSITTNSTGIAIDNETGNATTFATKQEVLPTIVADHAVEALCNQTTSTNSTKSACVEPEVRQARQLIVVAIATLNNSSTSSNESNSSASTSPITTQETVNATEAKSVETTLLQTTTTITTTTATTTATSASAFTVTVTAAAVISNATTSTIKRRSMSRLQAAATAAVSSQIRASKFGVVNCFNAGVISEHSKYFKCICPKKFAGTFCEKKTARHCAYKSILNGTFCIEDYIAASSSFNSSSLTRKEDAAAAATNFTLTFGARTIAYEKLLVSLVDDIWSQISPESVFLKEYSFAKITNHTNLAAAFQKLEFYAKFALANVRKQLCTVERVLEKLSAYLANRTSETKSVAAQFQAKWNSIEIRIKNATVADDQQQHEAIRAANASGAADQIQEQIERAFNSTWHTAFKLYKCFNTSDHKNISDYSKEQVDKIVQLVESVQTTTVCSWNKVVDYGFWFVTRKLTGDDTVNTAYEETFTSFKKTYTKRDLTTVI